MVARLLYRDGLMLVIDKPAGLPCIGAEGRRRAWRTISTRCASACRARRRSRIGSTATPPAAWCSAATARRWRRSAACSSTGKVGKTYWAVVEGGPDGRRRPHRPAARPARRHPRLVDEARPERPAGGDDLEGDGARGRRDSQSLARARAGHRPHASAARALRGDGLADRRRQHLRQRAAHRRADPASAFARDRGAALQESRSDPRHRAGAGAHARAADGLRVGRGRACDRRRRSPRRPINKSSA